MPPETGPCYLLATTPWAALKKFFRRSLYTPRLRRGLAAISSPQGSIILRYGKTTPIYRFIRESCREDGAGDPCCGDCCRCPVCLSRAPVSGGERQTRADDRDRRGNWSGNRQIREGSADDGGRTAGARPFSSRHNTRAAPPHPSRGQPPRSPDRPF